MSKVKQSALTSTMREKIMYGFGDTGGALILTFISTYLIVYYTDSVGLAATYAGAMMLACRLLDGISDIIAGFIIDKTHTRWGKARPWFVLSTVPVVLSFVASFLVPSGLSESGLQIYTAVTYFLLTVVFYTINNISYHAMLQRFSLSSQDRSVVSSVRGIMATIGGLGASVATPILLSAFGGEKNQSTWTTIILIYGVVATFFLAVTALGVKEKIAVTKDEPIKTVNAVKVKDETGKALKILFKCRYFYIAIILILFYVTSAGLTGMGYYYARDVLGNLNYLGTVGMISLVPMVLGMPFVPILFRKFGKRNTMIAGLAVSAAASLAILINPYSTMVNLIFSLVKTVGTLPIMTAISTLPGDIADYNHMRQGIRSEGLTTSAYSIGLKLGNGIGAAIVAWMLAIGKYEATLEVQMDSAITAMIVTTAVIPAVLFGLAIVLLLFWDIEKYQPEVQAFMEKQVSAVES